MNEVLSCDFDDIDWQYSRLLLKLEEALLFNWKFWMELPSLYSTCDISHHRNYYPYRPFNTFCPSNSPDHRWKLCHLPDDYGHNNTLQMTYLFPPPHYIESERGEKNSLVFTAIAWLSLLHGNFPYFGIFVTTGQDYPYSYDGLFPGTSVSMAMVMESLPCSKLGSNLWHHTYIKSPFA